MARLLAVVAGCNSAGVAHPEVPPLEGAENDARDIAELFTTAPLPNGTLGSLELLIGQEATTDRIREAVQEACARQTADDTVLFYFAGHGRRESNGRLTLLTWDGEYPAPSLLSDLGNDGLSKAIILDCCHAGAIDPVEH